MEAYRFHENRRSYQGLRAANRGPLQKIEFYVRYILKNLEAYESEINEAEDRYSY